ncbi:hypothetical protein, partial [Scytonema sp. PCC 10023]|uniref:hypothetical protein n=1 Tax=Scytonema sp. PCC 10023 TaxID=1680591 RepID=UPI0039C5AA53
MRKPPLRDRIECRTSIDRKGGDGCADDSTVRRCGNRRCAIASNVEHGLTEKAAMVVLMIPPSGDAETAAA